MKRGFKVLHCKSGDMLSCVMHMFLVGNNIGKYEYDEWTTREKGNGPLAVFTTMASAVTFVKMNFVSNRGLVFIPCQYEESTNDDLWYTYDDRHGVSRTVIMNGADCPSDTAFADKVMLLHE